MGSVCKCAHFMYVILRSFRCDHNESERRCSRRVATARCFCAVVAVIDNEQKMNFLRAVSRSSIIILIIHHSVSLAEQSAHPFVVV